MLKILNKPIIHYLPTLKNFCLTPLRYLAWLLSFMIPVDKSLWLICCGKKQYWGGNVRAFYEEVAKDTSIRIVIFNSGQTDPKKITHLYDNCELFQGISWKNLWLIYRSQVIVISHGTGDIPFLAKKPAYCLLVNLWHGIALKGLGNMDVRVKTSKAINALKKETNQYDLLSVSSEIDRAVMSASFLLPTSKIVVTGLPRNDWLVENLAMLPNDLNMRKIENNPFADKTFILYAPTFRDWQNGEYCFSIDEVKKLIELLEKNNAILGIRGHVNDTNALDHLMKTSSCIVDCGFHHFPDIHGLLACADIVITDYSSLWVDYLLIDRPIIGFVYDLNKYLQGRNLNYDYVSFFPGELVKNGDELLVALENCLAGEDLFKPQRQFARGLLFSYPQGGASNRLKSLVLQRLQKT